MPLVQRMPAPPNARKRCSESPPVEPALVLPPLTRELVFPSLAKWPRFQETVFLLEYPNNIQCEENTRSYIAGSQWRTCCAAPEIQVIKFSQPRQHPSGRVKVLWHFQ